MFGLGAQELLIIGVIAVLLFGSRLPSVMRSLGKGVMEFKRGMQGIEEELDSAAAGSSKHVTYEDDLDQYEEPIAPKFEPPTTAPRDESMSGTS